ncbi:MAG: hypothetical protein P8M72_00405 [Gammaproteobacteria bacterium]|nr:hypothetical protein [Gammaproteobacteria bacterium]
MKNKNLFLIIILCCLSGCSLISIDLQWPEPAYPKEYFIAAFRADEAAGQYQTEDDYLLWITRFYNGSSLAPGWLNLTREVLERLEEPYSLEVSERLYFLGGIIASEWAKDNDVRLLDTRNASVWRDALIEALDRGDLDDYMDRVENDVASIMAGELTGEDIFFERYYIDEFD